MTRILYPLVAALALCVLPDCKKIPVESHYPSEGDSLPEFSITLQNGLKLSKNELSEGILLLTFFNTSCPDCRNELPEIQKCLESLSETEGVRIVAVSREEGAESVGKYWKDNGLTIPFGAQEDRKIYSLFASSGIPLTIVARNGVITHIHDCYSTFEASDILNEI